MSPDEQHAPRRDVDHGTAPAGAKPETSPRGSLVSGPTVVARTLVLFYSVAIVIAVLIPNPHAVRAIKRKVGMLLRHVAARVSQVDPTQLGDVTTNVAAFIPLTLLFGIAWRRVPAWVWGIVGTVISVCAEAAQYLVPELTRRPDIWNVVENSLGGWIGAFLAALLVRAYRPRRS